MKVEIIYTDGRKKIIDVDAPNQRDAHTLARRGEKNVRETRIVLSWGGILSTRKN